MKLKSLLLVLVSFLLVIRPVFAKVDLPAPAGYVNDFAEILSPEFEATLNQNITDFEAKTTDEISVVTIKSLGDMTVEEYAVELFQQWGIGKKSKDNGLLLLIAPAERKVRIEVGYGLESIITDGRSGEILDVQFVPEFKKGNYETGVLNTVNQIETYLNDPSIIPESSVTTSKSSFPAVLIIILLFTGLPIYLLSYFTRSKEFFTGGIVGAILGFIIGGLLAGIGLGLFGLLLDYILSKNYKNLKSAGKPTNFWSSGGGFRSSGGFRSGGGSFGGFGGSSSGGGGSSRGW